MHVLHVVGARPNFMKAAARTLPSSTSPGELQTGTDDNSPSTAVSPATPYRVGSQLPRPAWKAERGSAVGFAAVADSGDSLDVGFPALMKALSA
jgi:hypothetical protein